MSGKEFLHSLQVKCVLRAQYTQQSPAAFTALLLLHHRCRAFPRPRPSCFSTRQPIAEKHFRAASDSPIHNHSPLTVILCTLSRSFRTDTYFKTINPSIPRSFFKSTLTHPCFQTSFLLIFLHPFSPCVQTNSEFANLLRPPALSPPSFWFSHHHSWFHPSALLLSCLTHISSQIHSSFFNLPLSPSPLCPVLYSWKHFLQM